MNNLVKNNKGVKPRKKLIRPIHPRVKTKKSPSKVQQNRERFLAYMSQKHAIACKTPEIWSGSALHFLELTETISPGMRQAAKTYFKFSKVALSSGPRRARMRYEDPLLRNTSAFIGNDTDVDDTFEKHWKEMCSILDHHQTKHLMDQLKSDQDLPCLETLFGAETVLGKLKESLTEIERYLDQEEACCATTS